MPLKKVFRPRILSSVSITVVPRSEARGARETASSRDPRDHPRFHRQQTLALKLLASELAGAADGLRLLPHFPLGGLFIMTAEFHLAKDALALHFLLQHPEGLIDIVVTDENLHAAFLFDRAVDRADGQGSDYWRTVRTSGCRRHRRTNQRQYSKLCPPMATMLQVGERRLRYVAVFWAALRTQCLSVLVCVYH
jgi:hypothetical protein